MKESERKEKFTTGGTECLRFGFPGARRILLWLTGDDEQDAVDTVDRIVSESCGTDWQIIACEIPDWYRSLSPWPSDPAFGKIPFTGKAGETLDWIGQSLLPVLTGNGGKKPEYFIGGYSLAGLFSLWAFLETGCFSGAASMSGSLWYPGWEKYALHKRAPEGSMVYMSLGDREEKTRNAKMKTVGDATRRQAEIFRNDPGVKRFLLEWNRGGHFDHPDERIARGFSWLLS